MNILKKIFDQINIAKQCREYNISIWQSPQFLFLLMGGIIILSILVTDAVARQFIDPDLVALILLILTAVLFTISFVIVSSFERMAKSSKEKSDFISIMSHRLRSPLSAIKWQTELILGSKTVSADEQGEIALSEVRKQNDKMIRVINDLLDVIRIEDRKLVLSPIGFSLKNTVEEIVQSEKESAEKNNVSIFISAPDDLPKVFADEGKIKNVVYHFIDNAIRYSTNGGKVTVSLDRINGHIRCSVSDEGSGIPEKEIEKIFSKFFRGQMLSYYQTEGSGVGLFIAKAIIEASCGKIGFNSVEGRGSTFWFTLPISS